MISRDENFVLEINKLIQRPNFLTLKKLSILDLAIFIFQFLQSN